MSGKRPATTILNHENWDQDDPEEPEEKGTFTTAAKDVLEKRVIRTAKRRTHISTGDDTKKSVFSGFGGFNKAQSSSFDFLANLTNGSKTANGSPSSKNEPAIPSSLFNSKPISSSSDGGIFSATTTKSTFGMSMSQSPSLFAVSSPSNNTTSSTSIFTTTKTDTEVISSPFKIQSTLSSTDISSTKIFVNSTMTSSQMPSTIFGTPSTSADTSKQTSFTTSSTPFKIQPIISDRAETIKGTTDKFVNKYSEKSDNDKQLKYYNNLKGLNESVSAWIVKHVKETPLCILTPIFKDYEKHLKEIQDEYERLDKEDCTEKISGDENKTSNVNLDSENTSTKSDSAFSGNNNTFSKTVTSDSKYDTVLSSQHKPEGKSQSFSFGVNPSTTASSVGFSFGIKTSPATNTTTTNTNGTTPFSFGVGKPFSFNSNIQKPSESKPDGNEEEDEPPKVEFTPIVEENSVYDKRCKIFIKKDNNFVDKGVGTLYIKKIEESGKHQLLVRANTNLGNVLLNLILASAIPIQRMGKNNVMMVCIPTPETKPPPTPILIRVKTAEEADQLLATLNKYKA